MKNVLVNTCLSIVSIIVAIFLLEGAAQIYVHKFAKQGKLFEPDAVTGWKVKSQIELQRKNADGNIWTIRTDEQGIRSYHPWDSNQKRVLILGDSYAFGEGVDVEHRFDAAIRSKGYSVLNTGVMGFGTDQQFLLAKPYFSQLAKGDIVIVLTYYNDFFDIIRKQYSGRAKPWYDLNSGELQLHLPEITLKEILRDRSYIYARLARFVDKQHGTSDSEIILSSRIFKKLIEQESEHLTNRGVYIILAYHGISSIKNVKHKHQITQTLSTICESATVHCIDIDARLNFENSKNYFLADGHWNIKGHKIVGALVAENLPPIE